MPRPTLEDLRARDKEVRTCKLRQAGTSSNTGIHQDMVSRDRDMGSRERGKQERTKGRRRRRIVNQGGRRLQMIRPVSRRRNRKRAHTVPWHLTQLGEMTVPAFSYSSGNMINALSTN